ncbi:MAG: hypothetical protein IKB05_00480 [Alphaproteobacteria bacterium]|nr:hypothetical protein [Alphaproteobacteria bacterium]
MLNFLYQFKYKKIRRSFNRHYDRRIFDVSWHDDAICRLAEKIYETNHHKFKDFTGFGVDVGFFATMLYKTGGHTPCLVNLLKSISSDVTTYVFLSQLRDTMDAAPGVVTNICDISSIGGITLNHKNFVNDVISLYNQIISNCPRVALVYIHMWDLLFVAVMHLLRQHAGIKIIFFNHASHFPNVGMTISDLILEGMPTTQKKTENERHLHNCKIIGLQSVGAHDTKYYTKSELNAKRLELGIPKNSPLTVSGGTGYKFFDVDSSPYFEMIRDLLVRNPKLHHMVITNLDEKQWAVVKNLFDRHPDILNRLHIVPMTPDFDVLFQCADVFIDSFPVSAALTQVDLMRMRVASVVKINRVTPEYSFHEYMPSNYPYMYETVSDMRDGIEFLLGNVVARTKIINSQYEYWLKTYECNVVKDKYIAIIKEVLDAKN